MLARTHFLAPISLPLLVMFLALLLLFAVPPAALYAQSAPDSGDNGKALPLFDVDRADDNVTGNDHQIRRLLTKVTKHRFKGR